MPVLLVHDKTQARPQDKNMSSLNHKPTVDEIIAANGKDGVTHIIEYKNIFTGATTWKLCNSKELYLDAMKRGAFIDPFLLWEKK